MIETVPVGTVPFVYMVTGEFPYTWLLDLFPGIVPRLIVLLLLWMIDILSDIDICMMSIERYCHELFNCLICYLIMILSGRRGLIC